VVQNENAELRKQQVAALADFDRRLAATGAHAAVAAAAPPASTPPVAAPPAAAPPSATPPVESAPPPVVETTTPEQRYGRAFDALKAGDYAASIGGCATSSRVIPIIRSPTTPIIGSGKPII
jgi:TolA-binding protein